MPAAGSRRVVRSYLLRRFAFIDRVYGKARPPPPAPAPGPKRPIFAAGPAALPPGRSRPATAAHGAPQ